MKASRTYVLIGLIGLAVSLLLLVVHHQAASTTARNGEDTSEAVRSAVLDASQADLTKVLTYRSRTFDADVQAALAVMTPTMQSDYQRTVTPALKAQALANGTDLEASVVRTSILSLHDGLAEVLAFVNQTATPASGASHSDSRRVVVSLSRVGGAWLMSKLRYF